MFAELATTHDGDGFAGGAPIPVVTLMAEKPEHRIVCYLKAQGLPHKEIAERTGYTAEHVGTILAQPWARKRVLEEINDAGRGSLTELFSLEAHQSLAVLCEIRDDKRAAAAVRVTACKELLDRHLGKSVARHEIKAPAAVNVDELDQKLEEVRTRQRDLVGRPMVRPTEALADAHVIE